MFVIMTISKTLPLPFLFVVAMLFSCNGKKKENDFGIGKHKPNSLIRNHLLFSSFDEAYSFPIWFDDSIVISKKIASITRNIFPESVDLKRLDSGRVVPAQTFHYFFGKNGQVKKVVHLNYFDHKLIGKSTYEYSPTNIHNGYAKAKRKTEFTFNTLPSKPNDAKSNPLMKRVSQAEKKDEYFLKFKGINHDEHLFIVPSIKNWGSFRIHQKLKPGSNDQIIIGSAYMPKKKYSVSNTVREKDVQKFEYEKGLIRRIENDKTPFVSTRSFQYDRRGYCISYVDSLFSDGAFLSRTVSKFSNNMFFNPKEIAHRKENAEGEEVFTFFETFEYEYKK